MPFSEMAYNRRHLELKENKSRPMLSIVIDKTQTKPFEALFI